MRIQGFWGRVEGSDTWHDVQKLRHSDGVWECMAWILQERQDEYHLDCI